MAARNQQQTIRLNLKQSCYNYDSFFTSNLERKNIFEQLYKFINISVNTIKNFQHILS